MLKKSINMLLCALCCTALLTSCGSSNSSSESSDEGNKQVEVKLESKTISGKLGKAFDIVDKDYKISDSYNLSVTFKRNDSKPLVNFEELSSEEDAIDSNKHYIGIFIVELLDESGDILEESSIDGESFNSLMNLVEGDETSIKFTCFVDTEAVKSFRVKSIVKDNENKGSKDSDNLDKIEDLDDVIDATKKSAEAVGTAMDIINSLTK